MDTLITYLPFYRIHEVIDYFMVNAKLLGVKHSIVYVDNVFKDRQVELLRRVLPEDVEIRYGNWRDRNLTFMRILRDAREEELDALVVDSDNLLEEELVNVDGELISRFGYYTVLDHETKGRTLFLSRSIRLGEVNVNGRSVEVYGYRIPGFWKGVFFIGPKQAVRLSKPLLESINLSVLGKIEESLKNIEPGIRLYVSDETTLGLLLYYSGIKVMPWVTMSHHMHHGSTTINDRKTLKLLVATAHAQLGRGLVARGMGGRVLWYLSRYKISQLLNFIISYVSS
ncbi:hypothetical protein [Caldivirga sp.]|uniref:hypothetical protein n=1 Tax=Caldivirga sp. TaxID=2080243 RepID=UPI0025BECFF5|nr:hypothetical protein [Caldivirga sp.]